MVDRPQSKDLAKDQVGDVGAQGRREIKPGLRGREEGARADRKPAMAYTAPGGAATGHGTDIDAQSRDEDLYMTVDEDGRAAQPERRVLHHGRTQPTTTLEDGARGGDRLKTK